MKKRKLLQQFRVPCQGTPLMQGLLLLVLLCFTGVASAWAAPTIRACKVACNKFMGSQFLSNNGNSTTITPINDAVGSSITQVPFDSSASDLKYRGDMYMGQSSSTTKLFTSDATNNRYLVVKFLGASPSCSISIEFAVRTNSTNTSYIGSTFTTVTTGTGDNAVSYLIFDFNNAKKTDKSSANGTEQYGDIVYWKYKISGASSALTYKVDWIATMNEAPTTENVPVFNDDPSEIDGNAVNNSTFTGYDSMFGTSGAYASAANGNILVMKQDEEISEKITTGSLTDIIIDGDSHSLKRATTFSSDRMIYVNNQSITLRNLVIDGNNVDIDDKDGIEVNKQLNLENCTLTNHDLASGYGIVKAASSIIKIIGKLTLTNNHDSHIFYVKQDRRIEDYGASYTDGTNDVRPTIELAENFDDGELVVKNVVSSPSSQISKSKYNIVSPVVWTFTETGGNVSTDKYSLKASIISEKTITMPSTGYTTLILPFDATIPNGVTAYTLPTFDGSKSYITPTTVSEKITRNTPVFITGTSGTEYTFSLSSGGSKAYKASATSGALTGVYTSTTVSYDEANKKYLYVAPSTTGIGFDRATSSGSTVDPYSCYMTSTGMTVNFVGVGSDNAKPAQVVNKIHACNKFFQTISANNGDKTSITPTYDGTDMKIVMAANGSEYRGDIYIGSSSSTTVLGTFTSGTDKYLAIKFAGGRPENGTTFSVEYMVSGNSKTCSISDSKKWVEIGDDDIYYFDITTATKQVNTDNIYGNIVMLKFKIAKATAETTYKVDWIATFDDIPTTDVVVNDDPADVTATTYKAFNATTWTPYTSMVGTSGAVESAAAGDYLVMNADDEISAKQEIKQAITIDGNSKTIKLGSSFTTTDQMFLVSCPTTDSNNKTCNVTFKDITFDGNNKSYSDYAIEVAGTTVSGVEYDGQVTLDGVTFQNFSYTDDYTDIRNAGTNVILKNLNKFSKGISLIKNKRIDATNCTNTSDNSITIYLSYDYVENYAVVTGSDKTDVFQCAANTGFTLTASNNELKATTASDYVCSVDRTKARYTSFASALSAAETNSPATITLLKDCSVDGFTVNSGKTITIEGGSYTLTLTGTITPTGTLQLNSGKFVNLTVASSSTVGAILASGNTFYKYDSTNKKWIGLTSDELAATQIEGTVMVYSTSPVSLAATTTGTDATKACQGEKVTLTATVTNCPESKPSFKFYVKGPDDNAYTASAVHTDVYTYLPFVDQLGTYNFYVELVSSDGNTLYATSESTPISVTTSAYQIKHRTNSASPDYTSGTTSTTYETLDYKNYQTDKKMPLTCFNSIYKHCEDIQLYNPASGKYYSLANSGTDMTAITRTNVPATGTEVESGEYTIVWKGGVQGGLSGEDDNAYTLTWSRDGDGKPVITFAYPDVNRVIVGGSTVMKLSKQTETTTTKYWTTDAFNVEYEADPESESKTYPKDATNFDFYLHGMLYGFSYTSGGKSYHDLNVDGPKRDCQDSKRDQTSIYPAEVNLKKSDGTPLNAYYFVVTETSANVNLQAVYPNALTVTYTEGGVAKTVDILMTYDSKNKLATQHDDLLLSQAITYTGGNFMYNGKKYGSNDNTNIKKELTGLQLINGTYSSDQITLKPWLNGYYKVSVDPSTMKMDITCKTPKSYNRSVTSGILGSICLPFSVDLTATGENASTGIDKVYKVTKIENNTVTMTSVTSMEAGVPYLFNSSSNAVSFKSSGTTVEDMTDNYNHVGDYLVGNFAAMVWNANGSAGTNWVPVNCYGLQLDNSTKKAVFKKVAEATTSSHIISGSYRCYLDTSKKPTGAKVGTIGDVLGVSEGSATGINAVDALNDLMSGNAVIYDLNGHRLNSLQKGINIVNGKKIIVK